MGRSKGASSEGESAEGGKGVRRADDKGKGLIRKGGCFASLRAKQPRQRSDRGRGGNDNGDGSNTEGRCAKRGRRAWQRGPPLLSWRTRRLVRHHCAAGVTIGIPVLHPLPNVAVHVVQAPGVGQLLAYRAHRAQRPGISVGQLRSLVRPDMAATIGSGGRDWRGETAPQFARDLQRVHDFDSKVPDGTLSKPT